MSDELRRLRDRTNADADAVSRVKRGVARELSPGDVKALLRTVPSPRPGAAERVKAGASRKVGAPRRPWGRLAAVLGGLVVVAALSVHELAPISAEVGAGRAEIAGVVVDGDGHGTISGTRAAPRIEWREGRARLLADGELLVRTREAEVRVRDEALDVAREADGTTVSPERGEARVRCLVDDAEHVVEAGAGLTCPPVSAEGMLGLARQQHAAGATVDAVLGTIDAGLARPTGSDAARDELAVLRLQLLAESGRAREALPGARAWLAEGRTLRRAEVERLAAALALTEEGCAGALPHLEALAPASLDAALRLAACAPDRAAPVLDAAAALARSPEDREALALTRSRLGVP